MIKIYYIKDNEKRFRIFDNSQRNEAKEFMNKPDINVVFAEENESVPRQSGRYFWRD